MANQFPITFNIDDKDYQDFKKLQSATLVRDPYEVHQECQLEPTPKVCINCHLRNTGYPLCWKEAREWEYSTNCHFQNPFELDKLIVDN